MKQKLLLFAVALLCSVGVKAGTRDYTSSMSNSTIDWTGSGSQVVVAIYTDDRIDGIETYMGNTTAFAAGDVLYQIIDDLPNGFYEISFYAWENFSKWGESTGPATGDNIAQVFANSTIKDFKVIQSTGGGESGRGWNEANTYTLLAEVTNGTLKYGIKNIAAGGNWAVCKPKSLIFLGETIDNNTNLTYAINNPSFETGDKTGWTDNDTGNTELAIQNNSSLEGKDGTYYAEIWWWDNTIDIHQSTPALPSGFYSITALAKAESGTDIKLYAKAGDIEEVTTSVNSAQDYSIEVYLNSSGNIKVGLKGTHYHAKHVGVDNFRLIYLGNPKATLTTLQGTIDDSYLNNSTYTNVGGSERTALTAAKIATAASETAAAYETALATVQTAIDAFVAAKDNYDALAAINAKISNVGTLTYADSEKKPSTHVGTSSSDAASYAASLTTALRAYVESNAMGEGVSATDKTSSINNAICPASPSSSGAGDYEVITGTGWTVDRVRSNTGGGWTDSDGTLHQPYYDTNGTIYNGYTGITTATMSQTVSDLTPGKYFLTVSTRSSGTLQTFYISGNGTQQAITNPTDVFGNGWDDTSVLFTVGAAGTAEILLYGKKANAGDTGRWFSADNFRLVRIGDLDAVTISEEDDEAPAPATANVTLTRTLKGGQWNGFSVPFALTAGQIAASKLKGATIKQWASVSENEITFENATEIVAGDPYLIKPTSDVEDPSFNGVTVTNPSEAVKGEGSYTLQAHLYNTALATDGSVAYVSTTDSSIKKLTSGGIKGLRAIFNIPTASGVKALTVNFGDDTTGILTVDAEGNITETGIIYNLAGQRLSQAQKGVNIINGKKVIIK